MKTSARIVLVVAAVVAACGAGLGAFRMWEGTFPWESVVPALVTRMDGPHGRVFEVNAETGGVFQVEDLRGVRTVLEIPPGALEKDASLTVAPLVPEFGVAAGVSISPASVAFRQPVLVTFVYGDASVRNADAPKRAGTGTVRATGKSQVLAVSATGAAVPVLVPRSAETEGSLPALIRGGGTYAVVVDAPDRLAFARAALASPSRQSVLEGAAALAEAGRLPYGKRDVVRAAASSAKNAKSPTAVEQFAARVLDRSLASASFVASARAEVFSGFYETRCKDRNLSLPEYLAAAQTAQMLGLEEQGQGCLEAAKTVVADQARTALADPNASIAELLNAMQRLQIIGADEETDLDERLQKRVEQMVETDAKNVSQSSRATKTDAAVALQRMQSVGVENEGLEQRLVRKIETAPDGEARVVSDLGEAGSNEDLIPGFDSSVIGLALMEGLGIGPDTFDQAGIEAWTEEMYAQKDLLIEFADVTCAAIVELGGEVPPICAGAAQKIGGLYEDLREEGYRVGSEVGGIQSSDYQEFEEEDLSHPEEEGDTSDQTSEEEDAVDPDLRGDGPESEEEAAQQEEEEDAPVQESEEPSEE